MINRAPLRGLYIYKYIYIVLMDHILFESFFFHILSGGFRFYLFPVLFVYNIPLRDRKLTGIMPAQPCGNFCLP